jgi:hypothetical protein
MIEVAHDLYLFDQTLLTFVFTVGCLFGESFYCEVLTVFKFLGQVDRCKVTFSYFFLWFELFVETSLVYFLLQEITTCLKVLQIAQGIGQALVLLLEGEDRWRGGEGVFEVKVQENYLLMVGGGLDDTFIIEG